MRNIPSLSAEDTTPTLRKAEIKANPKARVETEAKIERKKVKSIEIVPKKKVRRNKRNRRKRIANLQAKEKWILRKEGK